MTTCRINEPCVTQVMQMIEANPQPFIMEPEPVIVCTDKLCKAVTDPGPVQGPPLEYFIGREELLAFMFNNDFPPIPAPIPLPAGGILLLSALALAVVWKWRTT